MWSLPTAASASCCNGDLSRFKNTQSGRFYCKYSIWADYWNQQTRSHNTSFMQFTLVASSSTNRIQASFTCVSRCASSMPSVYVVSSDSIHTHPNTEIRRSTSIDYTAVPGGGYCHTKTVGVCHQSPMEHMEREREREREIKKFRVTKKELLNNLSHIYKRKVSPGGTFSLGNFLFDERENYQI